MKKTRLHWPVLRWRALLSVALAIFISLYLIQRQRTSVDAHEWLSRAKAALAAKQFDKAETFALRVEPQSLLWAQSRLVAGEAAMRVSRFDDAVEHFIAIPRDGSKSSVTAVFSVAEIQRDGGKLSQAEENYRYALRYRPNDPAIHERIAFLLGVEGRRFESAGNYEFLLRSGHASLEELVILADLERAIEQGEFLQKCVRLAPEDPLVELAVASSDFDEGRAVLARDRLQQVVQQNPQMLAAQAKLGELLVEGDEAPFREWYSRLPKSADEVPDIWYVRGLWARRQSQMQMAVRCFWETLKRSNTHRRATYQLGQTLTALHEPGGKEFSERAAKLFELTHALDDVLTSHGRNEKAVRTATDLLEQAGRFREASAWAAMGAPLFPRSTWPEDTFTRLASKLSANSPIVMDSANLVLQFDLSRFPDFAPSWNSTGSSQKVAAKGPLKSSIQFQEAVNLGLDFVYFNGAELEVEYVSADGRLVADASTPGTTQRVRNHPRMYEQTGGGVAVFDFDLDGAPDFFFPQGTRWKHGAASASFTGEFTDRLFRNRAGNSVVDVSHLVGLADNGFGQGCAAGDFDNDGFADLYVANIGRNQLYRNNGDGTFCDVSAAAGLVEDQWTASCAIVDLNADGLPDLFDVNYLTGPKIYEVTCNGHACSPKGFEGQPDRLRVNRGDGTFESVPDLTPKIDAKGLGIVAADFDQRGRPSLLIANDQVPNFFLKNSPSADRFNVRFDNEAFIRGLAFNEDGLAMASMGIAADDINGDGRIDYFITTFKNEFSTFFLQDANGMFVDAAKSAGLRAPTTPFVGWGTQFLDADRDGEPDLVIVNGHVDDYGADGIEYQMRSQFLHNTGQGQFKERMGAEVGTVFDVKRLGRGLAKVDWNLDGRMEFVASCIGDQALLATNTSTDIGHFVNVRLHARTTARDAIGAVITVATTERRWTKQLLAGDGYMASNERVVQFGIGDAKTVQRLQVTWPSGKTSTIDNVPLDATIQLIEASPRGIVWSLAEGTTRAIEVATQQ